VQRRRRQRCWVVACQAAGGTQGLVLRLPVELFLLAGRRLLQRCQRLLQRCLWVRQRGKVSGRVEAAGATC
jgi:hypothetical protein